MTSPHYPRYLGSAVEPHQFPPDVGRELAFAGRSNSGKSTALNVLLARRGLARTSKTPGRTQMINFFALDSERRVVDLPGYGYAKVSAAVRDRWQGLLTAYFAERRSLAGLILTVDIRRGITETDRTMLAWIRPLEVPVTVLLTKADKLGRAQCERQRRVAAEALAGELAELVPFSARSRLGLEAARARLAQALGLEVERGQ